MATIAPTYAYTTGAVLDVAEHNSNLYSEISGRSIIGEVNGNLNIDNLVAGFAVTDYLVRPEEAVRVRTDFARDSVDYFSESEGGPIVADESQREELTNVAGCGLRFWIPYAAVVVFNMGFFVNVFRLHYGSLTEQESSANTDFGDIRLQLSVGVDGAAPSIVQESKRGLPISARLNSTTPFELDAYDEVASFYIDLHHTVRTSGAGWCDIHLRMLAAESLPVTWSILRNIPKAGGGGAKAITVTHAIHNRVSFGIRHPVALVLKYG